MTEDRVRRLRDWMNYEQEEEVERDHFRQEDMIRGIRDIVAEREGSESPDQLPGPILTLTSDGVMPRAPNNSPSNFLMTIDPRILKRRRGTEDIIEVTPDSPLARGQVLDLNRARCLASKDSALDNGVEARDHRSPVNVFSVAVCPTPSPPNLRNTVPLPEADSIPVIPTWSR